MTHSGTTPVLADLRRQLLPFMVMRLVRTSPQYPFGASKLLRRKYPALMDEADLSQLLCRLEKKGYLRSTWTQDGTHPRKYFTLTATGESMLDQFSAHTSAILTED